jgi:hypothetical protein
MLTLGTWSKVAKLSENAMRSLLSANQMQENALTVSFNCKQEQDILIRASAQVPDSQCHAVCSSTVHSVIISPLFDDRKFRGLEFVLRKQHSGMDCFNFKIPCTYCKSSAGLTEETVTFSF